MVHVGRAPGVAGWVALLGLAVSGCLAGPEGAVHTPADAAGAGTSFGWATNETLGDVAVRLQLDGLTPSTKCRLLLGVAGKTDGRDGPRAAGLLDAGGRVEIQGGLSGGGVAAQVGPVKPGPEVHRILDAAGPAGLGWVKELDYSERVFARILDSLGHPTQLSFGIVGNGVTRWWGDGQASEAPGSAFVFLECNERVQVTLHASRQVLLIDDHGFDTAVMAQALALAGLTIDARLHRHVSGEWVDFVGHLLVPSGLPSKAARLDVTHPGGEDAWDLSASTEYHLRSVAGPYEMSLTRVAVPEVRLFSSNCSSDICPISAVLTLAAIAWQHVASFDDLTALPTFT